MRGWPRGEADKYTPILETCHDAGGWFFGLFDDHRLIGAAVLESRFIASSPYKRRGRTAQASANP